MRTKSPVLNKTLGRLTAIPYRSRPTSHANHDETLTDTHGLYGIPPDDLSTAPLDAIQFSPLMPGASDLETLDEGSLGGFTLLAPPGTIERRHAIALALRALRPGAPYMVLAPKDRGGARLKAELAAFGCEPVEDARRHHRICTGLRPERLVGVAEAMIEGGMRFISALGLWSQPGVFSWDRIDPGSALLAAHLQGLVGKGADFGCGIGVLARAALAAPKVTALTLIESDRRAVEAATRNCEDPRVTIRWADIRKPDATLAKLDFVVMNPPFHDAGLEDHSLGQTFIRRAAESLRTGGRLLLTANRHLPYEAVMKPLFKQITPLVEASGYKVYEARK